MLSAPLPASISNGKPIPVPTKPDWHQQFVVRTYPNGGQEVVDTITGTRKIVYGLRREGSRKLAYDDHETIWLNRDGEVIAIKTYDGIMRRYEGGEVHNLLRIDAVCLEKLTIEAETYWMKNKEKRQ